MVCPFRSRYNIIIVAAAAVLITVVVHDVGLGGKMEKGVDIAHNSREQCCVFVYTWVLWSENAPVFCVIITR